MKALSLRQPWAWLIAAGIKDTENRGWPTKFRGRFLIHASKSKEIKVQGIGDEWIVRRLTPDQLVQYRAATLVYGAIIGEATLAECRFRFGEENDNLYSIWAEAGLYGFQVADPKLYAEPIPCRGALGFFEPNVEMKGVEA